MIDDAIYIAAGLPVTLLFTFSSFIIGTCLAAGASILQEKKAFRLIIQIFISVFRGTPLILQLSIWYFAIPLLLGISLSPFQAGLIAISLNCSAYMIEILRSGIQSIPKGQFEAAYTLGIPKFLAWRDIIFPQVIRSLWPALINEIVLLSKETALVSIIGELDIMRRAQILSAEHFTYFQPMLIAGLYYYLIVLFISFIGQWIEKRWTAC